MRKILLCVLALGVHAAHAAAAPIGAPELQADHWSGGVIDNQAFVPDSGARAPLEPFFGTLELVEVPMLSNPAKIASEPVLGRDPQIFPGVALSFFTDGGDLVPFTQELIRYGSGARGKSYWDVLVQPGRVWSEPGDGGWSRAAFPFALVNSIEGETHNGLAVFMYRGRQVSNLRFQIVQQTAPFYIMNLFVAAGLVPATFSRADAEGVEAMRRLYATERADRVPVDSWKTLATRVGAGKLEGFDGALNRDDLVVSGLDYHGTLYLGECRSAGGALPWCDRARFGVWSATKALANETALLRLAEKFGPSVFELKIRDFVPEAGAFPGWRDVRFEDAIDMATGVGNGTAKADPNHIEDGYIDSSYARWYEAKSVHDKLEALLADGRVYPWGPGKVARYRDQDMFILGVAMNRFLESKEGASADVWTMLRREVFQPIGIHQAPTNRTIEAEGAPGLPLMAYGYYPTLGEMLHVARLYQNGGKWGERQILYGARVQQLLAGASPKGLPTGENLSGGQVTYINAFWVAPSPSSSACRLFYPRMLGWGGNLVALLPGGLTGLRLAKGDESKDPELDDTDGMARVAERLAGCLTPR